MQQIYNELKKQIKQKKAENQQLRKTIEADAKQKDILQTTFDTLTNDLLLQEQNPDHQPSELLHEASRVHILYSESLAHSDLKDRTLAAYQLQTQREALNRKLNQIEATKV
jgi:hypothetical protein